MGSSSVGNMDSEKQDCF